MKMPTIYYFDRSTSVDPPRTSPHSRSTSRHDGAYYRLPTPPNAMFYGHRNMATTEPVYQYHHASTSESARTSRSVHQNLTAALPSSPPRTTKSVRWKPEYELADSIVIPNREQNRELERRFHVPEQLPRSHHGRRRTHSPHPYNIPEEPMRYRDGHGEVRYDPHAPVQSMLDNNGDPYRC